MFFIYLDRIIMVYSHKTHALVKLEMENVLDLGILILIIINSITVSRVLSATVVFSTNKTYIHVLYICHSVMLKKEN